jgi:hypothetical protein
LVELCRLRNKLINSLARDVGNLEEKMWGETIAQLGAVQSCIMATRDAIEEATMDEDVAV